MTEEKVEQVARQLIELKKTFKLYYDRDTKKAVVETYLEDELTNKLFVDEVSCLVHTVSARAPEWPQFYMFGIYTDYSKRLDKEDREILVLM